MPIGSPAMGFEEVAGFGLETTAGTFAAMQHFARPLNFTLKQTDPPLALSGPTGSNVDTLYNATVPRIFHGTRQVRGNVTVEAEYDDIGRYLMNAVAEPTSQLDTPVANTYTHSFVMPVSTAGSNTPQSLSIARLNGNEDLRFLGCYIDVLELSGAADRICTVSMDIIGISGGEAEVADADTEGYSAAPWMEFHDSKFKYHATPSQAVGSLTEQTAGAEAIDWTIRMTNNWRALATTSTSDRQIREPIYMGPRELTLTVSRDFWDDQFFDHYFQVTNSVETDNFLATSLKLTSGENITGTTKYDLEVYIPHGLLMGEPNEYGGGAEILGETVTIKASTDGTEAPATFTLINGTTNAAGAAYGGSQS